MVLYSAGNKKEKKQWKKYRDTEERLKCLKTQLTSGENYMQYDDSASYILKVDWVQSLMTI